MRLFCCLPGFRIRNADARPCATCRETEKDWDTDLAEDIKGEVEAKYGPVLKIKVEKESQVRLTGRPFAEPSC